MGTQLKERELDMEDIDQAPDLNFLYRLNEVSYGIKTLTQAVLEGADGLCKCARWAVRADGYG